MPGPDRAEPHPDNGYQEAQARLIASSHRRLTGRELLPEGDRFGERLYAAPFVVLAHDTRADPVFFYANLAAQQLFEMSWEAMVSLPSRCSAEPLARAERQALLDRVARDGWIGDYSGVRISATGKRFLVSNATVWNLIDAAGKRQGQAAAFSRWTTVLPI